MNHLSSSNHKKIFLISGLAICIIAVLAGLWLQVIPMVQEQVNRVKRKDNLKQLHILMTIYADTYNYYPSVQPAANRLDLGGGVTDLYPLYTTGILEDQMLSLLQPPGADLLPFPDNPGPEDFNKNTIGWAYNSTAMPNETGHIPLLSEQGVCTGSLKLNTTDKGIKPISKKIAVVLFSNGIMEEIMAVKGKLSTSKVTADDWALLKD